MSDSSVLPFAIVTAAGVAILVFRKPLANAHIWLWDWSWGKLLGARSGEVTRSAMRSVYNLIGIVLIIGGILGRIFVR